VAFHIHISEATCNLLDRLGVYYCEEKGLTQIKVQLLTGVFYVGIYSIMMACLPNSSSGFYKMPCIYYREDCTLM